MSETTRPDTETETETETEESTAAQQATEEDPDGGFQFGGPDMHDGADLDKDDVVLSVEGLRKTFGGLVATDDATFEVERGTITGMIGPNGAGKSTLFNLVSGFYEPEAGSVTVNGVDVTGAEPHEVAEKGLVRTFQTPRKLEGMTVREAMLVGPREQVGESFLSLFTKGDEVTTQERKNLEDAHRILEEFEIGDLAHQAATDLSGGQMKLVELARAMLAEPEILLLDEPVAGVNPTLANKLSDQIERLNEQGTTFLVIEHDMEFIMNLADPIVVLDRGHVLTEGTPDEVRSDERVIDAYLGGGG
jgi:branched-chain amino acid transport system ATP-binding protein